MTTNDDIGPPNPQDAVEYFFASDASAIIEHTDRVLYMEDDDVGTVSHTDAQISLHTLLFSKVLQYRTCLTE